MSSKFDFHGGASYPPGVQADYARQVVDDDRFRVTGHLYGQRRRIGSRVVETRELEVVWKTQAIRSELRFSPGAEVVDIPGQRGQLLGNVEVTGPECNGLSADKHRARGTSLFDQCRRVLRLEAQRGILTQFTTLAFAPSMKAARAKLRGAGLRAASAGETRDRIDPRSTGSLDDFTALGDRTSSSPTASSSLQRSSRPISSALLSSRHTFARHRPASPASSC